MFMKSIAKWQTVIVSHLSRLDDRIDVNRTGILTAFSCSVRNADSMGTVTATRISTPKILSSFFMKPEGIVQWAGESRKLRWRANLWTPLPRRHFPSSGYSQFYPFHTTRLMPFIHRGGFKSTRVCRLVS